MLARRFVAVLLLMAASHAAAAQPPPSSRLGIVQGKVLDARTGQPLRGVQIRLAGTAHAVTTDPAGHFRLERVAAGEYVLMASVVGYGLVRRPVGIREGVTLQVDIVLSEGIGTYEERVDVVAPLFERTEPGTVGETTIGNADLLNLRGLVADDPLRAVQVVPGVASSDDFTAEFSVRGSSPRDVGIVLDGVPAASVLLHAVEGRDDTGSIARINSDVLDRATILVGSYPQRYGGRLGAQLELATRPGSRDRVHVRGVASTVTAAVVAEGPLAARRGAWLASVRQSYLDWVIRALDEDSTSWLDFTDGLIRLDLDLSGRHQVSLMATGGRSHLEEKNPNPGANSLHDGVAHGGLVVAGLRSQGASFLVSQRAFAMSNRFTNTREDGEELGSGRRFDAGYRVDAVRSISGRTSLEFGGQIHWLSERQAVWAYDRRRPGQRTADEQVNVSWVEAGAYGQVRWEPRDTSSLTGGARLDRNTLTGDTAVSPWTQVRLGLARSIAVTGGTGVYRQVPLPVQVAGVHGGRDLLGLERAWHADAGLEGALGTRARWQCAVFSRSEAHVVWAEGLEPRRVGGAVVVPRPGAVYENRLDGSSRGVELIVHRRDAGGVSGWVGYAYARTQYRDTITGERFDGDWDQRHTINAYGNVRLTSKTMAIVRYRYGSNVPLKGYYTDTHQVDDEGLPVFVAGPARNAARLPVYSRLDLRLNHVFHVGRRRLTLFVEVINVADRTNAGPSGGRRVEKLLPFIPAAGFLFEF
ncbi:MAG: TonB-dependent receptor [Acidobacteriota bacterium]